VAPRLDVAKVDARREGAMLARTTTLYALLEEYPYLEDFFTGFHEAFGRLAERVSGRAWARVVTVAELATAMNLPWLDFLRQVQAEVRRVSGVAPAIAGDPLGPTPDARVKDDLRALLRELECGASLEDLVKRVDALTRGLDAEGVAALARDLEGADRASGQGMAAAAGQSADWPAARLSLYPGHPARALLDEGALLRGLATHIEEVLDGLGNPVGIERWREARPVLGTLLERLGELERQARRLRLAWYTTISSRGGHSVTALVEEELSEALDAVRRSRAAASKEDAALAVGVTRQAMELVRRVLVSQEVLLVPAAMRSLDDDDWEAVAEQERVVGWALARDQTL
jgi:hypothetical protein